VISDQCVLMMIMMMYVMAKNVMIFNLHVPSWSTGFRTKKQMNKSNKWTKYS